MMTGRRAWSNPLLRRVVTTLPVLWLVVSVVFLLIHLVPGDPIVQMLGEGASAADVGAMRHSYGLDAPLSVQYTRYLGAASTGDLGRSLRLHDTVSHLILTSFPYTLLLAFSSMALGLMVSVPVAVSSAINQGQWKDRTLGVLSLLGLSFPNFALGPLLILLFSIQLGWLPVSGAGSGSALLGHLVLPAVTLGSGLGAVLVRMIRAALLEELGQDYIRTARAKGLDERTILYKHALRNALIPVITVLGLQFGSLLAGAIVTETIFSLPGIGRLTLSAISNRDYALVQGCILAIGLTYVAVNLLTDVAYAAANPRVRQSADRRTLARVATPQIS